MRKHIQLITNCETDTKNFAKSLAKILKPKDIVVLTGELGSGKTKFVEGFLSYFGLENEISSPTFTIVNEYKNNDINIYHFDVYRLADSSEFYEIGGDEYFDTGICLIEWGELIDDALPFQYIHISFEKSNSEPEIRVLHINTLGEKYDEIINNLKEELA